MSRNPDMAPGQGGDRSLRRTHEPQGRARKVTALDMQEGQDNNVRRLIPQRHLTSFDPFAQVDEYWMTPPAGFPPHPHQGFEGIIYVLEGAIHHSDTLGNDAMVRAGDLLRFCAGRGLTHSELPAAEGRTHAVQLWIALPRARKRCDPDLQHVAGESIAPLEDANATGRLLAGPGAQLTPTGDLHLLDLTLDRGARLTRPVRPTCRGILYVIQGSIQVQGSGLQSGEALLFERLQELPMRADLPSRLLLASAVPIDEPIRQWGSYVT